MTISRYGGIQQLKMTLNLILLVFVLLISLFPRHCKSFSHSKQQRFHFRLKYSAGQDFNKLYSDDGKDLVWETLRKDAAKGAANEPLLASFMHATILSHPSLESSLAFHLANQLASPAMIATQIQALFLAAFEANDSFRNSLRRDIIAGSFMFRFYSLLP